MAHPAPGMDCVWLCFLSAENLPKKSTNEEFISMKMSSLQLFPPFVIVLRFCHLILSCFDVDQPTVIHVLDYCNTLCLRLPAKSPQEVALVQTQQLL